MNPRWAFGIALCAVSISGIACEREVRPFQDLAVSSARTQKPVLSPIFPGGQPLAEPNQSPFQKNAYGTAEGKRLFDQFNCTGCHAHGGGGMGPPLMDDKWIYGSEPANIFESIVEGRPNGMPAWRNRPRNAPSCPQPVRTSPSTRRPRNASTSAASSVLR